MIGLGWMGLTHGRASVHGVAVLGEDKGDVVAVAGEEAGLEAAVRLVAGHGEGRLRQGVVLLQEQEDDGVFVFDAGER